MLASDDGNQPVPAFCTWLPGWTHVADARVQRCAQFAMAVTPRFEVADGQAGPVLGGDAQQVGQGQPETANGGLDGEPGGDGDAR